MSAGGNKGLVQTVLGPVRPSELGPTTTHEHLYIDFSFMYRPAQDTPRPELADAPITLENLGWIRRNYYSNRANLTLLDLDTLVDEVGRFRQAGGGAIVDATTAQIGRDPHALARISRESGVHVVMGAGYYVAAVHPEGTGERSVDDLAREIVADVVDGVDGSGIRAGIIGEVGCTWPLAPTERKSLLAAAVAQRETGAAILVHPGRDPGRAPGDTGAARVRRGQPVPRGHGAPGPHRLRVRRATEDSRVGLLPRVGPVRQRGVLLSAGRDRHAQRRPEAGFHKGLPPTPATLTESSSARTSARSTG